jgi:TRAP-type uncharacterized transport system fused permease subunit
MTDKIVNDQDDGLELARRMAEEEEGIGRRPKGWSKWVIPTVCVAWSLFQLSIASWLILDTTFIRAIHLGFALLVVYLNYPDVQKTAVRPQVSIRQKPYPHFDYVVARCRPFGALYIAIDYEGMTLRYGDPILRDLVIGWRWSVLLLEASRRVIGPALPVIAGAFIFYAFAGPYMPDLIAFKGVSMNRFVGQMTMSTEGIYGIPAGRVGHHRFSLRAFRRHAGQGGSRPVLYPAGPEPAGRFQGRPAKAAVMGSGLTGLVSGSSIANIVTTGTFTIPLMKKVGYPPTKAAAVEVAASTDGQLAPPIMGAAPSSLPNTSTCPMWRSSRRPPFRPLPPMRRCFTSPTSKPPSWAARASPAPNCPRSSRPYGRTALPYSDPGAAL